MYSTAKKYPFNFGPTSISAPSTSLIPLSKLSSSSSDQVCQSLANLRHIYGPQQPSALPPKLVLPIRKLHHRRLIHDESVPDSGYASAEEEDVNEEENVFEDQIFASSDSSASDDDDDDPDEYLDVLRSDPMERAFAIRWLTGFIARSDAWAAIDDDEDDEEADKRTDAIDNATNLLSILLGDDQEEGGEEQDCSVTRSFQFPNPNPDSTVIQIDLNDAPLSNEDHTSVGLQSWASSIVLSEKICKDPARFGLSNALKRDGTPLRILELGAGTGLLSILAAKLLSSAASASDPAPAAAATSISATDYHPDVLVNLRANIAANFPSPSPPLPIVVHQLDWEHPDYSTPMDQPFDLIFGADVIYHPDHAKWIKACVERLLARPSSTSSSSSSKFSSSQGGVFWLMLALRISARHEGMSRTVEDIFLDASSALTGVRKEGEGEEEEGTSDSKPEWQLAILEKVEVGKTKGVGREDERGYLLFKIGWVLC
ncbi:hypothetical protein GYMLUDRAFT_33674 [Collybiopsis luxurians FD-317 M1]|nr:hypothetical protein GYMLUDRAFT_33674 [Collybiopsis luxurians FD-317 M1]